MAKGVDWSAAELDAIVADYFAMLRDEIAGVTYSKTEHRRALTRRIDRSEGSIEFKHGNITAVLEELGVTGVRGYRARTNYQGAILDAIKRHLERDDGRDLTMVPMAVASDIRLVDAPVAMFRNEGLPDAVDRIVRRFDPVERDMRNRKLGLAGELAIVDHERHHLIRHGRPDLAERVRHVSIEVGDGLGYDIASFSPEGADLAIEVKTTRGLARTPFYMSRNERDVAERMADRYRLYRLHEFGPRPALFMLDPPLSGYLRFSTEVWRADFR